ARGELRTQCHHVIDIVPTILEAANIQAPRLLNGIPQKPMEGVSMVYSFEDAKAPTQHTVQYFEMCANRAIYHDGWIACTTPLRKPWETLGAAPDPDEYACTNQDGEKYPKQRKDKTRIAGADKLAPGKHTIDFNFVY